MASSDYSYAALSKRPQALAALIHSGTGQDRMWRPEELGAIFRHQLAATVLMDLGSLSPGERTRLKQLSEAQGLLLKSFSDLLQHPAPPLELLQLTKDFAKANMDHPESVIPGEIAAALYYASIAAAWVRLEKKLSRLSEGELQRSWSWASEQPWLDLPTRALFGEALAKAAAP